MRSRRLANELYATLVILHDGDPEQEVTGIAVPVLDACLTELKRTLPNDDVVVAQIRDVISVEAIEAGEPIRAADALLLVSALRSRLPNASATSSTRLAQRFS